MSVAIRVWHVNQVSFLLKPTPHIPQRYVVSLSKEGEKEAYRKRDVHLSLFLLYAPRAFLPLLLFPPQLLTLLLSTRAQPLESRIIRRSLTSMSTNVECLVYPFEGE